MFTTYRIPPMLAAGTTVRPFTWLTATLRRLIARFATRRGAGRAFAPAA